MAMTQTAEALQDEIKVATGIVLHELGADIPERTPYEAWRDTLISAAGARSQTTWMIADLLAYGERYGDDRYSSVLDLTGLSLQRIRNILSVRQAFPLLADRVEDLTFSHHEEVAAEPPPRRRELLIYARDHQLSPGTLRAYRKGETVHFGEEGLQPKAATEGDKPDRKIKLECTIELADGERQAVQLSFAEMPDPAAIVIRAFRAIRPEARRQELVLVLVSMLVDASEAPAWYTATGGKLIDWRGAP